MIQLSDIIVAKARDVGAEDWLGELDELVSQAAERWHLTLGPPLPGGTEAFVCRATRDDGTPAVLKMMIPRTGDSLEAEAGAREAAVLRAADGGGCARLFAEDEASGALLMEQLGPSLFDLGVDLGRQHEIMVACARSLWRPASHLGLPTGAEKAQWLIAEVTRQWEALDRPCPEQAIDHAVRCAEARARSHDDERSVLVHGDIHQWNTLRTFDGDDYKLIDPDGLLAEPAYDLGILMREDPVELMAGDPFDRAAKLAAMTDVEADSIWEWGVIERVSTGLLCVSIGLEPVGSQMLDTAARIARRS